MAEPINVIVVEDEPATLARLVAVVGQDPALRVVATAATLAAARACIFAEPPHVVLCDLGLPDGSGIDLIREVSAADSGILVMVLSALGDEQSVIASIMAGAKGYLLKDDSGTSICTAIVQLTQGASPISAAIARYLLVKLKEPRVPEQRPPSLLTERETQVLELVAQGYRSHEIADRLFLSYHTVVHHIRHVYDKLAVNSRSQAIGKASQLGLL